MARDPPPGSGPLRCTVLKVRRGRGSALTKCQPNKTERKNKATEKGKERKERCKGCGGVGRKAHANEKGKERKVRGCGVDEKR